MKVRFRMNCPDFDVDDQPLFYVKNLQAHNIYTKMDLANVKELMEKMCDWKNLIELNKEFKMMSAIKETLKSLNLPKVARKKKVTPAPAASASAISARKSTGGSNVKRLRGATKLKPVVDKSSKGANTRKAGTAKGKSVNK